MCSADEVVTVVEKLKKLAEISSVVCGRVKTSALAANSPNLLLVFCSRSFKQPEPQVGAPVAQASLSSSTSAAAPVVPQPAVRKESLVWNWFWQRLKELDEEILEHKAVLVEEGFKSVESIGLMTDDDCSHFKIPRGHMRQMQFIFKETKGKT